MGGPDQSDHSQRGELSQPKLVCGLLLFRESCGRKRACDIRLHQTDRMTEGERDTERESTRAKERERQTERETERQTVIIVKL